MVEDIWRMILVGRVYMEDCYGPYLAKYGLDYLEGWLRSERKSGADGKEAMDIY